jgi:segregation and condensation protein B
MKNIIEALLISTDTPLSIDRITEILDVSREDVQKYIDELNREYQASDRAFEIKEVAGGYQIYTLAQYAQWVAELHKRKEKLSRAALETLAIVAYHQPITRAEVEKTRGVDSSWILESLLQKGLIKTSGRVQAPGRPIKYATTNEFLRYFGINSIADLPKEEEFGETIALETTETSPCVTAAETMEKKDDEPPPSDAGHEIHGDLSVDDGEAPEGPQAAPGQKTDPGTDDEDEDLSETL